MLQKTGDSDLAAMIAHELGHRIGLSNSLSSTCNSIMRLADRQQDGTYKMGHRITANDVRHVYYNFRYDMRQFCTDTDDKKNFLDEDENVSPTCYDMDGDGATNCQGDCDDYDPSLTYDCHYYDPDPYSPPGGGDPCYREYECTDYWTCVDGECEYEGRSCGWTSYCRCGYNTYCSY